MKPLQQFGIIGYGRFGKLLAAHLAAIGIVRVYDTRRISRVPKNIHVAPLASVVDTDILFLLVPISQMENTCTTIGGLLKAHTIVVDACSVKMYAAKCMDKLLPRKNAIIATHPLFGPDSTKDGIQDKKIVVCHIRASRIARKKFRSLLDTLGLQPIRSTPKQHDKAMAQSQTLVHFIGRGLQSLRLQRQRIATPDYESLLRMQTMVSNDSYQLFCDMQTYNPYAQSKRKVLLKNLQSIEHSLSGPNTSLH